MMWTAVFWKATAERAIATTAQAGLGFFVVGSTSALELDWPVLAGVAGAAGIASVLKSLASGAVTGQPGIGHAEELRE